MDEKAFFDLKYPFLGKKYEKSRNLAVKFGFFCFPNNQWYVNVTISKNQLCHFLNKKCHFL